MRVAQRVFSSGPTLDIVQLEDGVKTALDIGRHLSASGAAIQFDGFLQSVDHSPTIGTASHMLLDFRAECVFEFAVYII